MDGQTTKIPTDAAIDAIQIICGIMEQADADGHAAQIVLGPEAVAQMRAVSDMVRDANLSK